jgi:hypothetical protein
MASCFMRQRPAETGFTRIVRRRQPSYYVAAKAFILAVVRWFSQEIANADPNTNPRLSG